MLRTLFKRSLLLPAGAPPSQPTRSKVEAMMLASVLAGMTTVWAGSALACTAANAGPTAPAALNNADGAVRPSAPAARSNITVGLTNAEGLKLRLRQQDTVLSAYLPPPSVNTMTAVNALTDAEPRRNPERERGNADTLSQRLPVLAAAEDSADSHTSKPIAMLAAALALMASIALRRSGKR